MTSLETTEHTAELVGRLAPYALAALERAAEYALWLHAEELTPEHLFASLFEDESSGATRLVLHAFADPETLGIEILALCPGIMVVGSGRSLPFSVRGVRAVEEARVLALEGRHAGVTPHHLLIAALRELPEPLRADLEELGGEIQALEQGTGAAGFSAADPLFRSFDAETRRALGAACRRAAHLGRRAISPAHLVESALDTQTGAEAVPEFSAARAASLFANRDEDETPLPARKLRIGAELQRVLAGTETGAETVDLLGTLLSVGSEELRALLSRQKITPELHARAGSEFVDPLP